MSTDRMSIKDSAGRDPLVGLQDAICNAAFDYLENHCPDIEEGRESAEWIAEALRIAVFRAGLPDGHRYLVCSKVDDSEADRAALKKERIDGESERQRVSAIKVRAEAKVDRLEHLVEAIAARCRLPHFETDRGNGDFKDRIADLIEAHRAG